MVYSRVSHSDDFTMASEILFPDRQRVKGAEVIALDQFIRFFHKEPAKYASLVIVLLHRVWDGMQAKEK